MIDDQIALHERVDLLRIASHPNHRGSQRRQIDDRRHTSEVLQDDSTGLKRQLHLSDVLCIPLREVHNVRLVDHEAVDVSQQSFQQHANRIRQPTDIPEPGLFQLVQTVVLNVPVAGAECGQCSEGIRGCHSWFLPKTQG